MQTESRKPEINIICHSLSELIEIIERMPQNTNSRYKILIAMTENDSLDIVYYVKYQ